MYKLMSLFLVSFTLSAVSFDADAGEKVDKILDVEPDGVVEIHNVRGEIEVVGWSNSQVKVTGTLDDITEKFIFTTEGGQTLIKVKLPRNSNHRSRKGSELTIMIPQESKVAFSGVATDLNMKKINGGVEINSVSGDIELNEIEKRTYINSVSGELKLKALEGKMEVSTVSGNLNATVDCQRVNVSSVSADVELNLGEFKSAALSTVSGDVKIIGSLVEDGELKLSSVSGDAFFNTKSEINAEVAMETAPGGDIVNQYSDDKPKSSFINSHNLRFTAGNGSGVIRMSTVSGSIGLKKD